MALVRNVRVSGGTGTRNLIFGYMEPAGKWAEGRWNKTFLHFFCKFFVIFDEATLRRSTLKNHQTWPKLGKNEENDWPSTISQFRVSFPPQVRVLREQRKQWRKVGTGC